MARKPAHVEDVLKEIAEAHKGRLTPEAVVEAARPVSHPLHRYFTWKNADAAHKRRLDEARHLISSVEYVVTTTPFVVRCPVFVRDPALPGNEQGYVTTRGLRTDRELARDAVLREFEFALSALRRAKALAAALDMSDAIEELSRDIKAASAEVSARLQ